MNTTGIQNSFEYNASYSLRESWMWCIPCGGRDQEQVIDTGKQCGTSDGNDSSEDAHISILKAEMSLGC